MRIDPRPTAITVLVLAALTLTACRHATSPTFTETSRTGSPLITTTERRRVQSEQEVPSAASKFELLAQENQALKTTHQGLTEHLELAAANIQRLTIENHQLRQALEAAGAVTRIGGHRPSTPVH